MRSRDCRQDVRRRMRGQKGSRRWLRWSVYLGAQMDLLDGDWIDWREHSAGVSGFMVSVLGLVFGWAVGLCERDAQYKLGYLYQVLCHFTVAQAAAVACHSCQQTRSKCTKAISYRDGSDMAVEIIPKSLSSLFHEALLTNT